MGTDGNHVIINDVADDGKSHMLLTDFVCTIDHIETNINSQS
jgi:hypothetical protein